MSVFRTVLPLPEYPFELQHGDKILSLGSCFADQLGLKLSTAGFQILQNPFGILYNPISLAQNMKHVLTSEQYREQDLVRYNDLWHSRFHHSSFSRESQEELLTVINKTSEELKIFLKEAKVFLLTFGTAFVWEEKINKTIVANCHKRPRSLFTRRRLKLFDIVETWRALLQEVQQLNPELKVILTVSPVRHTHDGLVENQRSKATLLLAVEQLCADFEEVHYFPAYELILDDLRDYRFYKKDMLHPSEEAVDYVEKKFQSAFFTPETLQLAQTVTQLKRAARHRPLRPQSEAHQAFIKKQIKLMEDLEAAQPYLDFSAEKRLLLQQK